MYKLYDVKYKYQRDSYEIIGEYEWIDCSIRVENEEGLISYLKEVKDKNKLMREYNESNNIFEGVNYKVIVSITEVAQDLYHEGWKKLELDDLITNMEIIFKEHIEEYDTEADFLEELHDNFESLSNEKVYIGCIKYQTSDFGEYIKDFGRDSFGYAIDDLESMLDNKLIKNIEG